METPTTPPPVYRLDDLPDAVTSSSVSSSVRRIDAGIIRANHEAGEWRPSWYFGTDGEQVIDDAKHRVFAAIGVQDSERRAGRHLSWLARIGL